MSWGISTDFMLYFKFLEHYELKDFFYINQTADKMQLSSGLLSNTYSSVYRTSTEAHQGLRASW